MRCARISVNSSAARTAAAVARRSRYQGLVPYTEADADLFFGREEWREVVTDNLRAAETAKTDEAESALRNALAAARLRAVLPEHPDAVLNAAFSPSSALLLTESGDGNARVWETADGRRPIAVLGDADSLSAGFSPDSRQVVTASEDGTARVWNVASGRSVAVLRGHDGPLENAAFSPSGKLIVTASEEGTARVWNAASRRSVAVLRGHEGAVYRAAFSPDSELIVTAGDDGTARVWNTESGRSIAVLRGA
jgi:WD40 repeat protein